MLGNERTLIENKAFFLDMFVSENELVVDKRCILCHLSFRWEGLFAVRGRDVVAFSELTNILGRGQQNSAQWTSLRDMDISRCALFGKGLDL